MKYVCKECKYTFVVNEIVHTHTTNFITLRGCPTCLKNLAMSKKCPKCGSENLDKSLNA